VQPRTSKGLKVLEVSDAPVFSCPREYIDASRKETVLLEAEFWNRTRMLKLPGLRAQFASTGPRAGAPGQSVKIAPRMESARDGGQVRPRGERQSRIVRSTIAFLAPGRYFGSNCGSAGRIAVRSPADRTIIDLLNRIPGTRQPARPGRLCGSRMPLTGVGVMHEPAGDVRLRRPHISSRGGNRIGIPGRSEGAWTASCTTIHGHPPVSVRRHGSRPRDANHIQRQDDDPRTSRELHHLV
jgi:hypothetical protein